MDYNIAAIFRSVWGIVPAFNVPQPPSINKAEQLAGVNGFQVGTKLIGSSDLYPTEDIIKSSFGTDVLFSFSLGGEQLKYFDPMTGELKTRAEEYFQIPAATLADFIRNKEVIKTKVSGGFGTVKELFTFGDWNIKIRGLIIDEGKSGRTAVELRRKLCDFENYADSIPVTGWLFTEMNISRLVINNIRIRQLEGKPWVIPFDMDCDSDTSPELEIHSGLQLKRVL